MRVLQKLQVSTRLLCVAAFFLIALAPTYFPERALGEEAAAEDFLQSQFLLVEEGFVMKTAAISEAGHRLAFTQGILHTVTENEGLNSIANLYNISVDTIRFANDLPEHPILHPGDTLIILPVDGVLHTVGRGQNLSKIALLYDVEVRSIIEQNGLTTERIYTGQRIIIPGGKPIAPGKTVPAEQPISVVARPGITPSPPRATQPPENAVPPPSIGVLQKPCDCTYTQLYHPGHYAVDLARNGGGPIFAAEDGVVIRAEYGWNGGYGNVIEIDHGNGLVTLYAHNKELHVNEGSAVRRGDVISSMGNTGRVYGQTGIHLHFEVILNGVKKSPLLYLQ